MAAVEVSAVEVPVEVSAVREESCVCAAHDGRHEPGYAALEVQLV